MNFVKSLSRGRTRAVLGSILLALTSQGAEVALELVSKSLTSAPHSGGDSSGLELSADGRWGVFVSDGNGLATNDHNGLNLDVFLRDLQTGAITLLSRGTNGAGGAGISYGAAISADGRFVVFESTSDDLVPGDANEGADAFLYDRESGALTLVSQSAEAGRSGEVATAGMSSDGRFVLFESTADDLAEGDANNSPDIFLWDRTTGETVLISASAQGTGTASFPLNGSPGLGSSEGTLSGDGRYVAFISTGTNLAGPLGANLANASQLYLWDTVSKTNRLISDAASDTEKTSSSYPVLSGDGQFLAFISSGHSSLPPGLATRLYVYNTTSGELVNVPAPGASSSGVPFDEPAFSENGQHLAYSFNGQVYLYDTAAGTNLLVSATPEQLPSSGPSGTPLVSSNGNVVLFTSYATNLTSDPVPEAFQLFSFDRTSGAVKLLSRGTGGGANHDVLFPALSADGNTAAFTSYADNLATNDNAGANDAFVVATSGAEPIIVASVGHASAISSTGNNDSRVANENALSFDGRHAVFVSEASDLVPNDTNGLTDIFIRDLTAGTTRMVSLTVDGQPRTTPVELHGISANGRTVLFTGQETIQGASVLSLLAYDTASGTIQVASILPDGTVAPSRSPSVTADGRHVAFVHSTLNQIFIRDLDDASTATVSPISTSESALISPGGKYVLITRNSNVGSGVIDLRTGIRALLPGGFLLTATSFSRDDQFIHLTRRAASPTGGEEIHLYSTSAGTTSLLATNAIAPVSFSPDGSVLFFHRRLASTSPYEGVLYDVASSNLTTINVGTNALRLRNNPSFSADGRFLTLAITNAIENSSQVQAFTDVYVYDRLLTNFTLISRGVNGGEAESPSSSASISADGRTVIFDSASSDLISTDRNQSSDVFVARLAPADSNNNGLEDGWEMQHFSGLGDAAADSDADGANNLQEFLAGTDPTDPASVLAVIPTVGVENDELSLAWPAEIGKAYQVQFRASLSAGEWVDMAGPVVATIAGSIEFDAPAGQGIGFYRLKLLP